VAATVEHLSEEELCRIYKIPIPSQLDLPVSYNFELCFFRKKAKRTSSRFKSACGRN
jgi:hypothetical protein